MFLVRERGGARAGNGQKYSLSEVHAVPLLDRSYGTVQVVGVLGDVGVGLAASGGLLASRG